MLKLKPILYELPAFQQLAGLLSRDKNFTVRGLYGSLPAVMANFIREHCDRPVLVIQPDSDTAEKFVDDLHSFMLPSATGYYPSEEVVPFEQGMFTPALYSMRMNALALAIEEKRPVIVTTPTALLRRVPPPETFRKNIVHLKVGEDFERDLLIEWLVESSYERVPIIEEIGQFSVRGGILDVFSFESEVPNRLEFFGDTIESIREFDILSQLSDQQVQQVRLLGKAPGQKDEAALFDYLPANTVIFWDNHARSLKQVEDWLLEAEERFAAKKEQLHIETIHDHYLPMADLEKGLSRFRFVLNTHFGAKESTDIDFGSGPPPAFQGNMKLFTEFLRKELIAPKGPDRSKVFILHDGKSTRERLEEIIEAEMGIVPGIQFLDGELHHGFALSRHNTLILTYHEIFNRLRMRKRKKRIRVSGSLIRSLQTLEYGDIVVHIDYGVARYQGTERLSIAGLEKEVIRLVYEDDDILYVSLDKLNRIQRFVSEEGYQPKLTKLGTAEWERVKKRTRTSVEKIARDLVELYAKRLSQEGHAFAEDNLWQREMEESFPFEDTPDQAKATQDVKKDMESSKSMDRLICGDVGYGKTEIAVRAAFKAVMDGKQVAVLVPTTILAQQHFNTFSERTANFPVRVDMVSRFRSRAEQNATLDAVAKGEVDILIGTHRLLSKDIQFKDLGLLVVDEEQRFGVTHKEKLKQLKVTVDTITLTATPIPRTLHLSLMGARDLSLVDTAPTNRLPILTEITTWDNQLIYKALTFEMERGGQVFFVHNRVQTIHAMAASLKNIVPKARIAVAHGQMKENELEDIMNDFHARKYDVLLATMIIENGVDIPNCNTIIVDRADRFGLAQLYQLRGRVGRSDRQAFAYLIIPPQERLSDVAVKRLYAIEEFAELGSGLKIAMRDLEIRGAGNLLGHKQSGFINAVGYDLYQSILQEAVEDLQNATLPEEHLGDRMPRVDAAVEIDAEMYFPDEYIGSPNEKVVIYHRLLNLENSEAIDSLVRELRDRFGPLPEPAARLIEMVKIKKTASKLYIKQVKISKHKMVLVFDEKATERDVFVDRELPRYINQTMTTLKFKQEKQLRAIVDLKGNNQDDRISYAKFFLLNL